MNTTKQCWSCHYMPVSLDIWQVLGSTTPYVIGSMATQPHTSWVKGIPFRKYGTPCRVTFSLSHNLIRNLTDINKMPSYVSLMFITSLTVLHRRWLERWKLDDLLHLVFLSLPPGKGNWVRRAFGALLCCQGLRLVIYSTRPKNHLTYRLCWTFTLCRYFLILMV